MFRFNLWARGPFFHPGGGSAPGLENPSPFPLPAHLAAHAGMLGLSPGSERALMDKETKEGSPSSSSAFPLFRPGDPLPAGLYSPLHQQFLRAQLDLAAAAQSQAAAAAAAARAHQHVESDGGHPASTASNHFILNSHPSAFVPAAKRAKIEEREEGEMMPRDEERLSDPPSPASRHTITPDRSGLDLTLGDRGSSPISNGTRSPLNPDGGLYCPVCRCRLEADEIEAHLTREMHELAIMYRKMTDEDPKTSQMSSGLLSPHAVPSKSRYETYLRIRGNRENRLSKIRGIRRKRMSEEMGCYNGMDSHLAHETSIEEEPIDVLSCDDKPESDQATPTKTSTDTNSKDIDTEGSKCNSCKELFSKCTPMASTTCWHVYCSRCWDTENQSCCPQCRQAVSPSDLRRIYL